MALDPSKLGWIALVLGGLAFVAGGCNTQAYCFVDCGDSTTTGTTSGTGGSGGDECVFDCTGGGNVGGGGSTGAGPCTPSNGSVEICDAADNDCNGKVDDLPDAELELPKTCGICANNCYQKAIDCKPDAVGCEASADPGTVAGTCTCAECSTDYFDLNGDGTCEYFCKKSADDDTLCNSKDDDCDGQKDEDIDFCTDSQNCGKCGRTCVIVHGTGGCVKSGGGACTEANTQCEIATCDCATPADCWYDLDGSAATGCEYLCEKSNGGVEICDGLDNDCDGKVDGADDSLTGGNVGLPCFGDPDGLCATAANAGVYECQGAQIVCAGMMVLKENDKLETCNLIDDDCDGVVDDSPMDAGGSCGVSAIFPCSLGTKQCVAGQISCVGAVLPAAMETCNGVDDDCDGTIDKTGNMAPPDSVGACNVPPAKPAGATQPCLAGAKACQGGQVVCLGSKGPTSATDLCGDDSNCDGALTNQPNLMSDPNHCGNCATDCQANAVHAIVACTNGVCQNQGCQPGYYDIDNNGTCEYPCTFVSAQEACNGVDDNCNGTVDEGVVTPLPTQVCGVSGSALTPECKTGAVGVGVQVACMAGAWKCTFPAGVCPGGCSQNDEICDALDNDCDGILNENVANFAKPCASDDGLPAPGHGACRTTGTFVCNSTTTTTCSAVKADCNLLAGGCTEVCDGIDNDCDGIADETFNAKGSNATNFVKPAVTKLASSLWMYSYEASRPSSTNQAAGNGNGFWTSAPAGQTIDKTPACSVPTKIPWFNVTPQEVEQTCTQMGGAVCSRAQFQTACTPNAVACTFGYNPRNVASCATAFTATKFCNIGPAFDFNAAVAGDQDGLLTTASATVQNCWADWSNLQGNVAATNKLFDLTGNLREITKEANNQYKLMGGAFNSESESGSACGFTFYTVDQSFKFFDTGFRCCFASDPTL